MSEKKDWLYALGFIMVAIALVVTCTSCVVNGYRKITFGLNNTVTIEDQIMPNSKGDTEYHVGLDDDGRTILDWFTPTAENSTQGSPAVENTDATTPGS